MADVDGLISARQIPSWDKPGDWIVLYAAGSGVVAHARVKTAPVRRPHPAVRDSERYPRTLTLDKVEMYMDDPIPIDEGLRRQLDAFRDAEASGSWGWFVQATRELSLHDFALLTRQTAAMGGV